MSKYPLTQITAPASLPVSLAEAKDRLRITSAGDDAGIQALIAAAAEYIGGTGNAGVDGFLGRALVSQVWDMQLDRFADRVKIPLPPLISIDSIKYNDTAGVEQTIATTVYQVLLNPHSYGEVRRISGQTWPSDLETDKEQQITIRFTAGYGTDWNSVPEGIRLAHLTLIGHWHEHRGDESKEVPAAVGNLLAPYRMAMV